MFRALILGRGEVHENLPEMCVVMQISMPENSSPKTGTQGDKKQESPTVEAFEYHSQNNGPWAGA